MNLLGVIQKYNTERKCLRYLEKLRWGKTVKCLRCGSENTERSISDEQRHHCNVCKYHFSVLVDSIFENTNWSLTNWFALIAMILNAKQGISAMELMRNLGGSYKTVWYAAMRCRCAMIDNCSMLSNVVEMDEAYFGGKPRKSKPAANEPSLATVTNKRGRGTRKVSVVGIVERKGNIALKVIEKLTSRNLLAMLRENVDLENSVVMTDANPAYKSFDEVVGHLTINHSQEGYVRGNVHINTVEGFWSIMKNTLKSEYKKVSKLYLPFYLVQAAYIYNRRNATHDLFEEFLRRALGDEKCLLNYKLAGDVKKIVYPKRRGAECV